MATNNATDNTPPLMVLQRLSTPVSATSTGTTLLPLGSTPPTATQGDQYLTQTITPKLIGSKIEINALLYVTNSVSSNHVAASILAGSTVIAADSIFITTSGAPYPLTIRAEFTTTSLTPIVFTVRCGGNATSTTTFNPFFGSASCSYIKVEEYAQ